MAGEKQQKKKRQAPDTSDIGRDTSNPFTGDVSMALQNELGSLANLWSLGGLQTQAPAPVAAQPQAPVAGRMDPAQAKYLEGIMNLWRTKQENQSPEAIRQNLQSLAEYEDPVAHAQEQHQARLAGDPWGPGGQFANRPQLSEEAKLASQGNTATNQWAQRGAVSVPTEEGGSRPIDAAELQRLNTQAAITGTPRRGETISPEELKKFNAQAALRSRKTYV